MASVKPARDEPRPLRITPEDIRTSEVERMFPGLLEEFARAGLVEIKR